MPNFCSDRADRQAAAPILASRTWIRRALGSVLLLCLAGSSSAASGQAPASSAEDEAIVVRALDSVLRWKELDPLLLARHAMSEDGRAALRHLSESRLLAVLEKERAVAVPDALVAAREQALDAQVRAAGDKDGIAGYLRKARLSAQEFRGYLRLSFVHETLTRRALGLSDDAPLNGEQQEIWIDEELRARGYAELRPPWRDGVVARAAGFSIDTGELAHHLRRRLSADQIEDDCYQTLLHRRMLARMPDLAPDKLEEYVEKEIERRRSEANADPRYKGIGFEKLLASQGLTLESLSKDPSVLVAALARLWVDRAYTHEALQHVYSSEREYFDGLYGAAIDVSMLFLRGAQFRNDLNPRTFAEAQAKLADIAPRIASKDDFQRLAKELSEDAGSRENGGALGYLTARSPRQPVEIQDEVARRIAVPASGAKPLAGPLRLANGCVLLWFGAQRPAPGWDAMSGHVHRELRKRFIEEALPRASLVTAFDAE